MRRVVIIILIASAALGILAAYLMPCRECQRELWEEVRSEAEQRGFDYCGNYHAAKGGDPDALDRILAFSECTDAASSLGHGCALVRVLESIGDDSVSAGIRRLPDSIRSRIAGSLEAGVDYYLGLHPDETLRLFPKSMAAASAR